jgi:omega-6 fatty acid desaturase / acyl-lipid omega-6 desaturase (Delta-12 desaturase)
MTQDQVFVPRTRSQRGLPPLNSEGESHLGASISTEIMNELHEAIGDSPIGAVFGSGSYLVRRCELT